MAFRWPSSADPSIVFGHGGYLLHRDGEGIAGTTVEHAGFFPQVTEAGVASIRTRAAQLTPALADAKVLRAWAGLRPGTPDGLPIIGDEPTLKGLWYATGHGRNGILLAGITGTIITHMLSGETTVEEIEALRPERFWSW